MREARALLQFNSCFCLHTCSDDEYVVVKDPPELVAARERLAQYTARKDEEEPPGELVLQNQTIFYQIS